MSRFDDCLYCRSLQVCSFVNNINPYTLSDCVSISCFFLPSSVFVFHFVLTVQRFRMLLDWSQNSNEVSMFNASVRWIHGSHFDIYLRKQHLISQNQCENEIQRQPTNQTNKQSEKVVHECRRVQRQGMRTYNKTIERTEDRT